ncbi:MAG: class I SAM-dependent methyltransferase [Gaiellaceae bacterium]
MRDEHAETIAAAGLRHNCDVPAGSPYDPIAGLYDEWSRSVVEDVHFYVEEALASGGPVLELGVGSGRIAVPTASAGVPVIGIDSSLGMLAVCRRRARQEGVEGLLDLRVGDLGNPTIERRVPLVTSPFRALMHLRNDRERLAAFAAVKNLLLPEGRLVFDVFTPSPEDVAETHGRWLEREPGIEERADWDSSSRTLTLSVRGPGGATSMRLSWLEADEWGALLERAGFRVLARYGWFDRRPYVGGEDVVLVAVRA